MPDNSAEHLERTVIISSAMKVPVAATEMSSNVKSATPDSRAGVISPEEL
jgi:hypothetical protein